MLISSSMLGAISLTGIKFASSLTIRASDTAIVNLSNNSGSIHHLASGILYGIPDTENQIPGHFYSDIDFSYFRGGGAQVPAPGRGWIWGVTEYKNRFASALSNYRTAIQNSGKCIFLIHDLWGADGTQNSSAPYPGDNGDWTSWDNYLSHWIDDMNTNRATSNLIIDIWNEPDLEAFWGRSQDQYLQMWGRTYAKIRKAWGNSVLISGPASAGEPLTTNGWWTRYISFIRENGTIPDQIAWHMESGGGNLLNAYGGLISLLKTYGLPMKPININEYAVYDEQVPTGSAWWISQLERVNAIGLRGNWLSGYQLHDFMASLLGKSDRTNATDVSYYPNGDFQVYKYYSQNMTGHKVGTLPSADNRLDVYGTVDGSKVRLLFGARPHSTGTWYIQINNLSSIGLPAAGSLNVRTWGFPFTDGHYGKVEAPVDKGYYAHTYSSGTLTLPAFMTDDMTAYAWEFSL